MKKNIKVKLIESGRNIKVPATIEIGNSSSYKVEISIVYKDKNYIGIGSSDLYADAFADLSRKLSDDIVVACCMTCKYGNMCPFGDVPGELHCTKNFQIKDKSELAELCNDDNFWNNTKVSFDSNCNQYDHQCIDFYTYNDYRYKYYKNS